MNDLWFEPNRWAWLPGTLLGSLGGLWGALMGSLEPQGKARGLVFGLGWALAVAAAVLLVAGVVAYRDGQPYGIWYGLGFPGVLVGGLMLMFLPMARLRYREAEQRRMQAQDIG